MAMSRSAVESASIAVFTKWLPWKCRIRDNPRYVINAAVPAQASLRERRCSLVANHSAAAAPKTQYR
jgi:hypothetical protein